MSTKRKARYKVKHKFRAGQVVAIREHGQLYARINMPDKYFRAYYLGLEGHGYHLEKELRPLTRREGGRHGK